MISLGVLLWTVKAVIQHEVRAIEIRLGSYKTYSVQIKNNFLS